jgi:hypothetical protein
MKKEDVLSVFVRRMKKLNINLSLVGNFPWIYIDAINGQKVKEKFRGNNGFTIAFYPIRIGQEMKLTDISEIIKLIKKYVCQK